MFRWFLVILWKHTAERLTISLAVKKFEKKNRFNSIKFENCISLEDRWSFRYLNTMSYFLRQSNPNWLISVTFFNYNFCSQTHQIDRCSYWETVIEQGFFFLFLINKLHLELKTIVIWWQKFLNPHHTLSHTGRDLSTRGGGGASPPPPENVCECCDTCQI